MDMDLKLKQDLFELIHVMGSMTSEHNLEKLLKMIVNSAVDITYCDAASLYLREEEELRFVVTTNKTLEERMGKQEFEKSFKQFTIPISKQSIAGFVADTGKPLMIDDVYHLGNTPYHFNQSFDEKNDYRNMSMLTVPLTNREDFVIGVLQLINKLDENQNITTFNPYDEEIALSMGSQAAIALENVRLTEALRQAHYDSIMKLSAANEFRDNETGFHVKRVSLYCELLAKTYGLENNRVEEIKFASPLHDIGKIGIPDHILKKPGRLTEDEYTIMKTHTTIGEQILGESDYSIMGLAKEIAGSHHEKWDGSGYPRGLSGEDIPLPGRITAIADVFDALSNERVYKPPFSMDKTFNILTEDSGTHFDPKLIDAFLSVRKQIEEIFVEHKDVG